jgi:hypothetical protein
VTVPEEFSVFAPHRYDVVATGRTSIRWATTQLMVT